MSLVHAVESRLADGFAIRERLGEGATSLVFLAERPESGEAMVVKVLRDGRSREACAERFLHEVRVLRQLDHPRIVPVRDVGVVEGGLFFTMPYLGRETLRARLRAAGTLPVPEALAIAHDLTVALGHAHGHGVLHRDLKPENVLLTADGAMLMDFGFAGAPAHQSDAALASEAGLVIGTPDYVSPEQVHGRGTGDWRSDYFSLGCVLYEMLGGRTPYAGGGGARAVLKRRVDWPAPDVRMLNPAVPDDVAAIVRRLLERSPNDRYATASDLARALELATMRGTAA